MGTLLARKRKDGTLGYTATVRIFRDGKFVVRETQTFDRKQAAEAWIKRRETELAQPGALEALQQPDPSLAQVIDQYIEDSKRDMGKTKAQVLRSIKNDPVGAMKCSEIDSTAIIAFAKRIGENTQPQTVSNYLSHLSAVFTVARPAWGYPLNKQAMDDAVVVARRMGILSRSKSRDRRPTREELDRIMEHFGLLRIKRPDSPDMQKLITFAIYSTRRLEEITTIKWADLDEAHSRILVRDLKHPGEKIGNNQWCDLPPEALKIILSMPRTHAEIFPFNPRTVSSKFTRAMPLLSIDDLHFHDLRHHGISRLFEMGKNIPQVATVSAHRSWVSLKRYAHLRETGDCMAGWGWLETKN